MNPLARTVLAALVRHALTAWGAMEVLGEEDVEQLVGVLAVVVGLAWSWLQKVWAKRTLDEAEDLRSIR